MSIESPIKIDTSINVSVDVAEIIKQRSINYGYNEYIYIGDKSIRLYSIDQYGNKNLNNQIEDCKCHKCPYAKKNNKNFIIKTRKDSVFKKCNCVYELEKLYNYFINSQMWTKYIILQIDCKICRKQFDNPEREKIISSTSSDIINIINGSKPYN